MYSTASGADPQHPNAVPAPSAQALFDVNAGSLPVRARKKPQSSDLRVLKKLAPHARGAKGLTARYGERLVCVRHRIDETGARRLTTVELIVAENVISRRPGPTVDVAVRPQEKELQAKLKAAGARWHKADEVWSIRRSTAIALGLKARIVPRRP